MRFALTLFFSFLLLSTASADERILSFTSDITVHENSDMTVVETIVVRAEGNQIRRGIYREFPTDYRDTLGNRYKVGFEVDSVRRDGYSEAFFTEKYSNGVRVYIGERNRLLASGEYSYEITYRTSRQLGYFQNYDELYWNVTGNGWGFPIDKAKARVHLPRYVANDDIHIEGYTGYFGTQGRDYEAYVSGDSTSEFAVTRVLQPQEGLTIVVNWPKGVVTEPGLTTKTGYLLRDNRGILIALTGLGLMFWYLYSMWRRYGKDPEPGPVFPHYEPPVGLSPGACRYISSMSHDNTAFTAAIMSLAVKGYVRIHEGHTEALDQVTDEAFLSNPLEQLSEAQRELMGPIADWAMRIAKGRYADAYVFEKITSPPDDAEPLGPGEKALLKTLFSSGDLVLAEQSSHKLFRKAKQAHQKALKGFYQKTHFVLNANLLGPAVGLGVATVLAVEMFGDRNFVNVLVLFAVVAMVLVFAKLLQAPTKLGRQVVDHLEGFKEYLVVAEASDIARIEGIAGPSPEKTPELFERYLPYALVLGVDQPWADQFEQVFARLAAEQGQSYRTSWYNSNERVHNFGRFASNMTTALNGAISSASTAPGSSSGSGGGGSSGGGGGGGGGGGW